jgi:hypothetical protein
MKRFLSLSTLLSILIVLFSVPGKAAAEPSRAQDLDSGLPATVEYLETRSQKSFFDVKINDPQELIDLYAGWCIQNNIYGDLHNEPGTILYYSTSPDLPADLAGLPWNEINYVLNHKIHGPNRSEAEFINDVQGAIWILLGSQEIAPEYDTELARLMASEASTHPDFVPSPPQVVAVIVYSDGMDASDPDSFQEAVIEVPVPLETCILCQEVEVDADFSQIPEGGSVEGLGVAAPDLNIQADGEVVKIVRNGSDAYAAYGSKKSNGEKNYGLADGGGFTNISLVHTGTERPALPDKNQYIFTFADGVTVSNFTLRMLDFGDYNPSKDSQHFASMAAYDAQNGLVSESWLRYDAETREAEYYSFRYGQLTDLAGDAGYSQTGDPGNWTWSVSGLGITRVELTFYNRPGGQDPNVGFDSLSYTICVFDANWRLDTVTADFNSNGLGSGDSVEGLGLAAPGLNINASHLGAGGELVDDNVVKIVEGGADKAFSSKLGSLNNYGIAPSGGFTNMSLVHQDPDHPSPFPLPTQSQYTFDFELPENVWVTSFSLRMLDFGDYNPSQDTSHKAAMTAYQGNKPVAESWLIFASDGSFNWLFDSAGDAGYAKPGDPGNLTWFVSEFGITRVELTFYNQPGGQDPNVGFDSLKFGTAQCP